MAINYDKPFAVKIYTSSHGTARHNFPQALEKVFQENDQILFPTIDAKGGRMITDKFVEDYLTEFNTIKDSKEPRITVLLLGDNNIRTFAKRGAFMTFKNTKQIIDIHKESIHPLLLLGVMPSPATHAQTIPLSEYLDDILQEEVEKLHSNLEGTSIAFVCTSSFFTDSNGFLRNRKYFKSDQIHLNSFGSLSLAGNIVEKAKMLVDTVRQANANKS